MFNTNFHLITELAILSYKKEQTEIASFSIIIYDKYSKTDLKI